MRWLVSLLLACAMTCLGCQQHLVGLRDVELDYDATLDATFQAGLTGGAPNPAGGARALELVRGAVLGRLAAGHVTADVDAKPPHSLRVTVDEASAEAADELLEWRAGLKIYRFDPEFVFAPASLDGLNAKVEPVGGKLERYFSGDADTVFRAVRATSVDPSHWMVVQGEAGGGARTRAASEPPLADLSAGVAGIETPKGKVVALHLAPAELAQLQALAARTGSEPLAVVRDRTVVAVLALAPNIAGDSLRIGQGDDLLAYTRAAHLRRLLESPALPRLVRTDITGVPANWALASACVALPLLLSLAWLFFVRRFDRARPEPIWLVLLTFALGGMAAPLSGLVEWGLASLTPYLNPQIMTLGGQLFAAPIALAVTALCTGLPEEGLKLLAAQAVTKRRREFDEPVDGIVYASAAALGFAAVENVEYFAQGRLGGSLIASRAFMTVPAHVMFSAIWGYALGRKLIAPRTRVALYLLAAAVVHGAFDAFLSIDGLAFLAAGMNLALASVFIILLRISLRHGVVTPEAAAVPAERRVYYPVGSRVLFALFAIAMHVVAGLLFALGIYAQALQWRVGPGFVAASSVLLALFALVAYGLGEAIPLDVVLDEYGVTFGGLAVPWQEVVGMASRRFTAIGEMWEVRLQLRNGAMTLGPGRPAVVQELARAVGARVANAAARAPAGAGVP